MQSVQKLFGKSSRFLLAVFVFPLFFSVLFSACSPSDWRAKSGLQVITNDVPSALYLDGKYLDKTPYINKEIDPGDYTLEIRPDDTQLVSYQTKVSLKKGLLTVVTWKPGAHPETSGGVTYEMEKLPSSQQSQLSLVTIPDGAIVRVDGKDQQFSPVLVDTISAGEHEYEVSLPSYESQKHTINVIAGYRMDVTVKLAKQDGGVPVSVTSSAVVPTPSATPSSVPSPKPLAPNTTPPTASASGAVGNPSIVPPPKIVILGNTGLTQNGQQVLRVRLHPDVNAQELGFAPVGTEYPYLEQSVDGWYRMTFQGQSGWVSAQFSKVIEK
jgi:hypothetical protein